MTGKILLDVLTNLNFAREEWQGAKKLCFYCQSATVISLLNLMLALPEAKAALSGDE